MAGYTPGKVIGFPGQQSCQSLNEACLTFYWVDQASPRQFTFTYQLSNGMSNSASVTFNVAGPANVSLTAPTGVVTVAANPFPNASGPWMTFGTQTTTVGIRFTATATSPQGTPGTYSWVQLVRSTKQTYRTSGNGAQYCTDAAFPIDPATNLASTVPALDNVDPYDTGLTTRDSPGSPLNATVGADLIGEQKNATSFKMFLMWNPDLPNSIRVPLGTIDWQWACDAINTLTPQPAPNNTNWVAACAVPQTPGTATFVAGTTHPEWQRTAQGVTGTCRSTPL